MERDDRIGRHEPQNEETEVERNVLSPDAANLQRVFGADRTRSRGSFPANNEGLDGDRLAVINGGKLWMCEKVQGKWHRQEFGRINEAPPTEETAKSVVNKSMLTIETGVEEAPQDGIIYGRKDADWEAITHLSLRDVTIIGGTLPDQTVTIDGGTL